MRIEKTDSTIYRIIEAYGYQVIGKFATMILESLDTEYKVVTDIAIIDTETNEVILKKSMVNTSPAKARLFEGIEAFLYFIRNDNPDSWTIHSVFQRVFEENKGSIFIFQMNNRIKHDMGKAKRIKKLENDIEIGKEALRYAESKGYTVTDVYGCIYALKFDTEEDKKAFLNMSGSDKASALCNIKFKHCFTFVKSFEDISSWRIGEKIAYTNMKRLCELP